MCILLTFLTLVFTVCGSALFSLVTDLMDRRQEIQSQYYRLVALYTAIDYHDGDTSVRVFEYNETSEVLIDLEQFILYCL